MANCIRGPSDPEAPRKGRNPLIVGEISTPFPSKKVQNEPEIALFHVKHSSESSELKSRNSKLGTEMVGAPKRGGFDQGVVFQNMVYVVFVVYHYTRILHFFLIIEFFRRDYFKTVRKCKCKCNVEHINSNVLERCV